MPLVNRTTAKQVIQEGKKAKKKIKKSKKPN